MDTTAEVKTRSWEIGQVSGGKETKLENGDQRHFDLPLHLHFGSSRPVSGHRQRQGNNVGQQPCVGTGADRSSLGDRFSINVGHDVLVGRVGDVGNNGLIATVA